MPSDVVKVEICKLSIKPYNTEYLLWFWVALPSPLGVPDEEEVNIPAPGPFPERSPALQVIDTSDDETIYLDQSWIFFHRVDVPASPGLEFAESIFKERSPRILNVEAVDLDVSDLMKTLGERSHTIVEVVTPVASPDKEDISSKLKDFVRYLSEFQLRLNRVDHPPAAPFTENSFDVVPYLVQSVTDEPFVSQGAMSIGKTLKYSDVIDMPTFSGEELTQASQVSSMSLFRTPQILEMEAHGAYVRGSNLLAAIAIGAAVEARLTELCQYVCWEAEVAPSEAAKATGGRGGVSNKCLEMLGKFLKGSWKRHSTPELITWDRDIVKLRNETAHNGYIPTDQDIEQAYEAFAELKDFLSRRLLSQITKFPYVGLTYLGTDFLEKSNQKSALDAAMENYALTPDPEGSFNRYKQAVRYYASPPTESDLEGANMISVSKDGGEPFWVQLDDETSLCRYIVSPHNAEYRKRQSFTIANQNGTYIETLTSVDPSTAVPRSTWFPAAEIVPSLTIKRSDAFELLNHELYS